MCLLRASITSVLLLCALVKSTAGASDGFLGTGLSFYADLGIVIAAVVLIIIIIVFVSCTIYCCTRKKSPKGKEKSRGDNVYPEDRDGVQGWRLPNSEVQMFGELPDVPVEERVPSSQCPMPALAQLPLEMQPIPANYPPSQLQTPDDESPPQGQMFQQFPAESVQGQRMAGRPSQPIELQPYHGALESSISPFLAQSAIAAELAEKGKSKKKKERSEVEGPISLYDGPPPPMAPNPYPIYNQSSARPPVASGYVPPYTADANAAQGGDPMILAEPRSSQGYPLGYQSFLPQLAATQPQRTAASNPLHAQSVYSLSNRLNDAPPGQQRYGSEGGSRQLGRSNYPPPAQSQGSMNRNRMDGYDYMLH